MDPHRWAVGWAAIAGIDRWSIARLGAFALAIGVAYAAWSYQSHLIAPTPAVLRLHELPPSRGHAPARRVVWIMVDGLRLDASRDMHVLNKLRADGEDVCARAEFPTYSGPNLVAQASGLEPAASGVMSNRYPAEVAFDSVFRRAKMAGLRTALITDDSDPGPTRTYASWVDETDAHDPDLPVPPAELVFVHIGYVDATGRPLVHANVVTVRQRAVARAAVRAASSLHVDHVPLTIPVTVVVLLMLSTASSRLVRPLIVSPIYAVVFFGLLLATHTLSFSVSNDPGSFTARVIALSGFAALAQLRVGGRSSLAPASLVTSLVVLGTTVAASQQPLAPTGGLLLLLPISALAGLDFSCLVTAALGLLHTATVQLRD